MKELQKSILQIPDTNLVSPLSKDIFTSVIVLNKDSNELLKQCIDSFLKFHSHFKGEIIIGDTGSSNAELRLINQYIKSLNKNNVKLINLNFYNYSQNNNDIVKNFISEESEYLLFLNNDVEFLNNNLDQFYNLINNNRNMQIGTIGSHLVFLNQMTQHAGIFVQKIKEKYYFGHNLHNTFFHDYSVSEVFGNTGAVLLIKKDVFEKCGMFNQNYKLFQDVLLNIECLKLGLKNIYCGTALAYHFESSTRHKSEYDKIKDNQILQMDLNKIQNYCIINQEYFKKYYRY